jgi:Family of unknown function (DUF5681)/ParB/Sulfiredoxin domain
MVTTQLIAIDTLKANTRNARTHSKKQIRQIANSISAFGFVVPILIDENQVIIAGHGRLAAARLLGLPQVPVIEVRGLSEPKRRALALADNKISEHAGWDREILAVELPAIAQILIEEGVDISITGFAPVEIDQLAHDFVEKSSDPCDSVDPKSLASNAVKRPGDSATRPPEETNAVGYGRPPRHTQFKPGRSGNPKGRPKGCQNIRSQLVKVFTDPVVVNVGGKRRRIPAVVAVQLVLFQQALNGNSQAMQLLFKTVKEYGILDATELNTCSCRNGPSDEYLRRLSDATLDELMKIEKELEAENQSLIKPH